ncbi:MAG: hypothetical protein E7505_00280 [Ruminococcus sp.]|nr:hypothetical protein [Ruminococcus sp.]
MKLSYREKIGLLVLIVAVIIVVFIAWPIKVVRKNIDIHTKELEIIEKQYDDTKRLIEQIPIIENNIMEVYDASKGLSEKFTVHRDNLDIDKYFETLLNKEPYKKSPKNALEITGGLSIGDASTGGVPFYRYTPNVITYPILELADTNGNLMETSDKALYDKVVNALNMETLVEQTVEVRTVSVPMKFTKEALLALEDELKKDETGIRITNVSIGDYTFSYASEVPEEKGYSEGDVTFEFYTMQQIQKPEFNN